MPDLLLYNTPTPNGHQVTVFLQELKAVYPEIQYEQVRFLLQAIYFPINVVVRTVKIDIFKNTQKVKLYIYFVIYTFVTCCRILGSLSLTRMDVSQFWLIVLETISWSSRLLLSCCTWPSTTTRTTTFGSILPPTLTTTVRCSNGLFSQ